MTGMQNGIAAEQCPNVTIANNTIYSASEQGIKETDFDMLAEDVLKEPVLGFNPRQGVTKEQVIEILHKAF